MCHLAVVELVVCSLKGLVREPSPSTGCSPSILHFLCHFGGVHCSKTRYCTRAESPLAEDLHFRWGFPSLYSTSKINNKRKIKLGSAVFGTAGPLVVAFDDERFCGDRVVEVDALPWLPTVWVSVRGEGQGARKKQLKTHQQQILIAVCTLPIRKSFAGLLPETPLCSDLDVLLVVLLHHVHQPVAKNRVILVSPN